jgi:biopolymer transport protein ExbD
VAFAPKKRLKHREVDYELELVPFIDMLVVCCCFLLMSAALLQTAVIEISLPSASGAGAASAATPQGGELNLSLIITNEGYRIGGSGAIMPLIQKKNGKYDWAHLEKDLTDVKKQFPDQTSVIIISEPEIVYDDIIHAMDRCVAKGFPDISLSGSITQ